MQKFERIDPANFSTPSPIQGTKISKLLQISHSATFFYNGKTLVFFDQYKRIPNHPLNICFIIIFF